MTIKQHRTKMEKTKNKKRKKKKRKAKKKNKKKRNKEKHGLRVCGTIVAQRQPGWPTPPIRPREARYQNLNGQCDAIYYK